MVVLIAGENKALMRSHELGELRGRAESRIRIHYILDTPQNMQLLSQMFIISTLDTCKCL